VALIVVSVLLAWWLLKRVNILSKNKPGIAAGLIDFRMH
jgi:hypothetical protein